MEIGQEEGKNKRSKQPTLNDRELMSDELYSSTLRKGMNRQLQIPEGLNKRKTARGLREAVSGKDSFYSPRRNQLPDWNVFESNETASRPRFEFRDDPFVFHGAALWEVSLNDLLLDPFSLGAEIVSRTVDILEDYLPTEADIKAIIFSIFRNLTFESFSASSVEALIQSLFSMLRNILTAIEQLAEELLQRGANEASSALSSKFSGADEFPESGDYIYTSALGNIYNVFEVGPDARGDTNPDSNTIFAVPFSVSIGRDSRSYFAITTFPVPNVPKLIKSIFEFFISLISKAIAKSISGAITAIYDGAVYALKHLKEFLMKFLGFLEGLINGVARALQLFEELMGVTVAEIMAKLLDHLGRIKALEDLIPEERSVTYLDGHDGYPMTIQYLALKGAPVPQHATGSFDVRWRQVDYMNPYGQTFEMTALLRTDSANPNGNNTSIPDWTPRAVTLCESGTEVNKIILTANQGDFGTGL